MTDPREGAHVWIRYEHDPFGGSYVCGDEDGEFARTSGWPMLIPYVEELVLVAGNVRDGGLAEADAPKATGPRPSISQSSS